MADVPLANLSAAFTALQEPEKPEKATPRGVFLAAVNTFLAGQRLDMGRLAADAGIAKATLYRWTGARERLLSEILTYLAQIGWDMALAEGAEAEPGQERVRVVLRSYLTTIIGFEPLRQFVRNETQLALRLLTMRGNLTQEAVINWIAGLLQEENERGTLPLRAPIEDVAFALTKVGEGFIYSEPFADIEPDPDAAMKIVELLVGR